jgi:hypothetical protein
VTAGEARNEYLFTPSDYSVCGFQSVSRILLSKVGNAFDVTVPESILHAVRLASKFDLGFLGDK